MRPVSGPLDDTHGRPATRSSCHPRPETRTPKSEYRCDARTVEHLQNVDGMCSCPDPVSTPTPRHHNSSNEPATNWGDSLLKRNPSIFMAVMKSLAVIVVATRVMRADLVRMQQERDKSFRAFAARVRSNADTCDYITKCTCLRDVDFTDSIIRDVMTAGIADLDIRHEVLGTSALLGRAVNDVISLVKSKEITVLIRVWHILLQAGQTGINSATASL